MNNPCESIRFFHFHDRSDPRGGCTVAVDEKLRAFAVAFCCPRDNFNRRLGREISSGRLRNLNTYKWSGRTPLVDYLPQHGDIEIHVCQIVAMLALCLSNQSASKAAAYRIGELQKLEYDKEKGLTTR